MKNKLDAGIAFDGDADRCLAVDENGQMVDGDFMMAILRAGYEIPRRVASRYRGGHGDDHMGFVRFCRDNGLNFVATKWATGMYWKKCC